MFEWALIRCLGEGNLMQATEDYENQGWEIFTMMFLGFEKVEGIINLANSKDSQIAARYIIIARRPNVEQN